MYPKAQKALSTKSDPQIFVFLLKAMLRIITPKETTLIARRASVCSAAGKMSQKCRSSSPVRSVAYQSFPFRHVPRVLGALLQHQHRQRVLHHVREPELRGRLRSVLLRDVDRLHELLHEPGDLHDLQHGVPTRLQESHSRAKRCAPPKS